MSTILTQNTTAISRRNQPPFPALSAGPWSFAAGAIVDVTDVGGVPQVSLRDVAQGAGYSLGLFAQGEVSYTTAFESFESEDIFVQQPDTSLVRVGRNRLELSVPQPVFATTLNVVEPFIPEGTPATLVGVDRARVWPHRLAVSEHDYVDDEGNALVCNIYLQFAAQAPVIFGRNAAFQGDPAAEERSFLPRLGVILSQDQLTQAMIDDGYRFDGVNVTFGGTPSRFDVLGVWDEEPPEQNLQP